MTGLLIFSAYAIALSCVFYHLNQPYNRDWWLKITTAGPRCIYYFGPFQSQEEANEQVAGYRSDLESEKARVVQVKLNQQLPPAQLTFSPDETLGFSEEAAFFNNHNQNNSALVVISPHTN